MVTTYVFRLFKVLWTIAVILTCIFDQWYKFVICCGDRICIAFVARYFLKNKQKHLNSNWWWFEFMCCQAVTWAQLLSYIYDGVLIPLQDIGNQDSMKLQIMCTISRRVVSNMCHKNILRFLVLSVDKLFDYSIFLINEAIFFFFHWRELVIVSVLNCLTTLYWDTFNGWSQ